MTPKSVQPGRTPLPRGIASPARRVLAHLGVETLEQLAQLGQRQMAELPGMCPKTLAQLHDALDEHGLEFAAG
jgi:predicted RecB family nuclease